MTSAAAKRRAWLIAGAAVLLVAAANAHLLHVARASQPECVAHLRRGEPPSSAKPFSAAVSSCTPYPRPTTEEHR